MTHVTAMERVFTRQAHHRRPRPAGDPGWTDVASLPVDPPNPGEPGTRRTYRCFAPNMIDWPDDATVQTLGAWSVTDGEYQRADGAIDPFTDVGSDRATTSLLAWFYHISGGIPGQPGATELVVDELLIATQTLLDDDFVTVAGDEALTTQANADGWLATDVSRVLQAAPTIGDLVFDRWLFIGAGTSNPSPGRTEFDVPANTQGLALAAYTMPIPNDVTSYLQYVPHIDLDTAVAALRSNTPPGPVGQALASLAANVLVQRDLGTLNPDSSAAIGQVLREDAKETLTRALQELGAEKE